MRPAKVQAREPIRLDDNVLCAQHLHDGIAEMGGSRDLHIEALEPIIHGRGRLAEFPQCMHADCESTMLVFHVWPVERTEPKEER